MNFRRTIRLPALMCTAIGGMLGSGWLFGPFLAAQIAGPASILSWALGGVLMMFIACCFAELSAAFPIAGGMARFAELSHGSLVGFTIAWVSYLAAVIVSPMESMAAVQYAANYYPILATHTKNGIEMTGVGMALAVALMFLLSILNTLGARFVSKSNMVLVVIKFIVPVLTVGILLTTSFHPHNFFQSGGFAPYGWKGVLSALPSAGIIFSFIGYGPAVQLAQEAKNPKRAIPIAIIGSLMIAMLLYICIQLAFVAAVDPSDLATGWSALTFQGDYGPIAGIITALGLIWFVKLIYADAFISPCGTGYIYTAATARLNYAMAKNHYFPSVLLQLNKKGVPSLAIAVNFVVGMVFFLPFPGWQEMIKFLVSCFVIAYTVAPITTLALRRHKPNLDRAFQVPVPRLFCAVSFIVCNEILYWSGWDVISKMLITIAVGYLFLSVTRCINRKGKPPLDWRSFWWMLPYFLGMVIISYCGSFGGGHDLLPFGWDVVAVALFSLIVLYLALASSRISDRFDQMTQDVLSSRTADSPHT